MPGKVILDEKNLPGEKIMSEDEKVRMICDLCGEYIEQWEFDDGVAFEYDEGALHEKCREEYFGAR